MFNFFRTDNTVEQKVLKFSAFVKNNNPDLQTLKNESSKLEKEIGLYKKLKGLKNLLSVNSSLLSSAFPANKTKLSTWMSFKDGRYIKIYENFPKPSYVLVFGDDEILFARIINEVIKNGEVSVDESEYKELFVVSEKSDPYEIEEFHPGEWIIEIDKCLDLFREEFKIWASKAVRANDIFEKPRFLPED